MIAAPPPVQAPVESATAVVEPPPVAPAKVEVDEAAQSADLKAAFSDVVRISKTGEDDAQEEQPAETPAANLLLRRRHRRGA